MLLPEGYTIKYIDGTDYHALLASIDKAFGPEWWDNIIKDPLRDNDQKICEEVKSGAPLDDWELQLGE